MLYRGIGREEEHPPKKEKWKMNGKVEVYTFNEGTDYEFFGLCYAGSDIVIKDFKTKTGAIRYAKKNGYEVA